MFPTLVLSGALYFLFCVQAIRFSQFGNFLMSLSISPSGTLEAGRSVLNSFAQPGFNVKAWNSCKCEISFWRWVHLQPADWERGLVPETGARKVAYSLVLLRLPGQHALCWARLQMPQDQVCSQHVPNFFTLIGVKEFQSNDKCIHIQCGCIILYMPCMLNILDGRVGNVHVFDQL